MKKIILFTVLFFLLTSKAIAKEPDFLIINQIRGDESCCEPGGKKLISAVLENPSINTLPIGWAIRYDALENKEIVKSLENENLGLLLELTPKLAKASGVEYKGSENGHDWYAAKNAFLIGYSQNERKRIINYLFEKFKNRLGYYPSFTTAWMIDSWSLSYISSHYRVKLHELTKEQYETDSYTLYGGVFNLPYFPSNLNPLIPGFGKDRLNLVVVRQTVSDLLRNYGSSKAAFTSQPNDYLGSKFGLDFSYFKELIEGVLSQQAENKLGVLGFENSKNFEKYQNEFINQLEYINNLQREKKVKIVSPTDYADLLINSKSDILPAFLMKDFDKNKKIGVLWYFGKTYRARILLKNNLVILDDLRIFSVSDPYAITPSLNDYSYFIIPYLFDGSQTYLNTDSITEKKYSPLLKGSTVPDFLTNPFGIVLGDSNFQVSSGGEKVEITFLGKNKGKVKFLEDKILIDKNLFAYFNAKNPIKVDDLFKSNVDTEFKFANQLDMVCKKSKVDSLSCGFSSDNGFISLVNLQQQDSEYLLLSQIFQKELDFLNPIFQPDKSDLNVDSVKSVFFWHNHTAIAGRNPIRLFILPLNSLGRPVTVKDVKVDYDEHIPLKITLPDDYFFRIKPWFVDFSSDKPAKALIGLKVDGQDIFKSEKVEFVPDCRRNIKTCIFSPLSFYQYFSILLTEQKNFIINYISSL